MLEDGDPGEEKGPKGNADAEALEQPLDEAPPPKPKPRPPLLAPPDPLWAPWKVPEEDAPDP